MATIIRTGGGGASANLTLPPQIRSFAAVAGNTEVSLSWLLPELTDDYAGLRIVRKAGSMPLTPSDGAKIELSNTATNYTDTGLTNDTAYYYRAFPYNAKGQFQTELSGAVAWSTPKSYNPVFRDNSWEQINAISMGGQIPPTWMVRDTKDITLTTGEVLTLQIYGFNHDDLAAGGKAGLTLGLKNLMETTRKMNNTATNIGGFAASDLNNWLNNDLYNLLPSDLKPFIKLANKKMSGGGTSPTLNVVTLKIFGFSVAECFGTSDHSLAGEGTKYPVFTDNASRVKLLVNGTGSANGWWMSSARASNSTEFGVVQNNGVKVNNVASTLYGVCFGFCI